MQPCQGWFAGPIPATCSSVTKGYMVSYFFIKINNNHFAIVPFPKEILLTQVCYQFLMALIYLWRASQAVRHESAKLWLIGSTPMLASKKKCPARAFFLKKLKKRSRKKTKKYIKSSKILTQIRKTNSFFT